MSNKFDNPLKQHNHLSLPVGTTRRRLLQLGGSAGMGLAIALVNRDFWHNSSQAAPLPIFEFQTVTVDSIGQIIDRRQGQAEFFAENLGDNISLEMVKIPGGNFQMGSPITEAERYDDESPQHPVNISSFYLGKYTVTQEQWQAIMGNNPSYHQGDKRPVEQVSWNNAMDFCQKLSQKSGKNYRLPSEAEWEYACRAGTITPFHFGETITSELANYDSRKPYGNAPKGIFRKQPTDVGIFPPNAFGVYDMHGNVWEWCSDRYHENYNNAPPDGSSWKTSTLDIRIVRGGSWVYIASSCRSASRPLYDSVNGDDGIGFRVVVS